MRGQPLDANFGPGYTHAEHERDSWAFSLHVLKAVFPDITGIYEEAGLVRRIPDTSSVPAIVARRARKIVRLLDPYVGSLG